MEYTGEIFPIKEFLAAKQRPERILPRKSGETWSVRTTPVFADDATAAKQDWSLVRGGELVMIPLIPYRVAMRTLPALALSVAEIMQRLCEQSPAGIRTHVIIGEPIEDLYPDGGLRYWLGFAVQHSDKSAR